MNKTEKAKRFRKMKRLYGEQNRTLREIADEFDLTFQRIHAIFAEAGIALRHTGSQIKTIEKKILERLYAVQNLTIRQIADKLQVSPPVVSREIERHGIEKRSPGHLVRTQPVLHQLKVGEKAVIKRPDVKYVSQNLHSKARRIGIKISIQSLDDKSLEIHRIK